MFFGFHNISHNKDNSYARFSLVDAEKISFYVHLI